MKNILILEHPSDPQIRLARHTDGWDIETLDRDRGWVRRNYGRRDPAARWLLELVDSRSTIVVTTESEPQKVRGCDDRPAEAPEPPKAEVPAQASTEAPETEVPPTPRGGFPKPKRKAVKRKKMPPMKNGGAS